MKRRSFLKVLGGAIKGPSKGILGGIKDTLKFEGVRNPRAAAPGILNTALRLGMAPRAISALAGLTGWGAIAAGLLQAGELGYRAYKGEFNDLFSSEGEGDIDDGTPKYLSSQSPTYLNLNSPANLDRSGIMGLK